VIHPSYYDACDVSCDVIYYVIAVRARRMVRIFFVPYLGNRSKSDPCLYELFCLESHILSFRKVLQFLRESPCMCRSVCAVTEVWIEPKFIVRVLWSALRGCLSIKHELPFHALQEIWPFLFQELNRSLRELWAQELLRCRQIILREEGLFKWRYTWSTREWYSVDRDVQNVNRVSPSGWQLYLQPKKIFMNVW